MSQFPPGPITLLMTDIEGSTALWERDAEAMEHAVARHDALVAEAIAAHRGTLLKERGEGDSHFAVFPRALDAVQAALALQQAIAREPWGFGDLRIRAAVHTGETFARAGDLYGPTVNRCGRLRSAAHGGQTLVSNATRELLGGRVPEGSELRDLGSHRLKDLLLPERIFELAHEASPNGLPPIKTLNLRPHNLPIQLTSFVGRAEAQDRLHASLDRHRLVTLLGPGGCGKTRLSLQTSADRVDAYADGVWQVELAPLPPKASVAGAIASTLSIAEVPGTTGAQALTRALEDKQMLIVLDNCEHVAENAASVVRTLLGSCPGLTVLATSRSRLGVPGEASMPLGPLEVPGEFVEDLEALGTVESVRLFCDRAGERDPEFQLNAENAFDVAELCRSLEGIPLAIEFLAGAVGLLSTRQILERWKDRSLSAGTDDRGRETRQQTLRNSIDWSVDLLSEGAAEMLALLSVFAGGWTLEAAEAVVGDSDHAPTIVLSHLRELSNFSLVLIEDRQGGEKRFRFLEPVRQYAAERLREVPPALRARFVEWVFDFAREAGEKLTGPDQARWLQRVQDERGNLRKAFEDLLKSEPERALELAFHTRRFWVRRGPLRTGRRWFERALEAAPDAARKLRCDCLNVLGALLTYEGDLEAARAPYLASLDIAQELGDQGRVAQARTNLGILESHFGSFKRALTMFEESARAYEAIGDARGVAQAQLNVGMTQHDMGNHREAIDMLTLAYGPLVEAGETSLVATCLGNRARAWAEIDERRAAADFDACLRIETEVGDPLTIGNTMRRLALLGAQHGHHEAAWHLLGAIEACLRAAEVDEVSDMAEKIEALVPEEADRSSLERARSAGRSLGPIEAAYAGLELCARLTSSQHGRTID